MKTTLFLLISLDGKISTGAVDDRDFDKDLPHLPGVAEGLHQYYDIEKTTDWYSFITGKVLAKIGWNDPNKLIEKSPVRFVVVDNLPHLTTQGVENLLARFERLYIVTTNSRHPASTMNDPRLEVVQYQGEIDFRNLFGRLERQGAKAMTVQSGGDMNAELLRAGLIDEVMLVVAPVLVGGCGTPSLIGGKSLVSDKDLGMIQTLEIIESRVLNDNYLLLRYKVRP